jgi:L-asparaginase/Glu-tRNA(Gln) amidotransferase subunit D
VEVAAAEAAFVGEVVAAAAALGAAALVVRGFGAGFVGGELEVEAAREGEVVAGVGFI